MDVIGPCPADTVYHRAQTGKVGGIVYKRRIALPAARADAFLRGEVPLF